jgi:hypothetical protein
MEANGLSVIILVVVYGGSGGETKRQVLSYKGKNRLSSPKKMTSRPVEQQVYPK